MSENKMVVKLLMKILDEKRKNLIHQENDAIGELNKYYDPDGKLKIEDKQWFKKSADPEGDEKALSIIRFHERREMLDSIYYEILDDLLEGE